MNNPNNPPSSLAPVIDELITLSGIADEAGDGIAAQIAAHAELGWKAIELRLVDKKTVSSALPPDEFAATLEKVRAAGLTVTGVASAIGNWSRPIDQPFDIDLNELKAAIPRMQALGTTGMRTMSWKQGGADQAFWRDEAVRRYKELAKLAEDAGIVLLHENCEGWAGQSAQHTREFMAAVGSPAVGVLFDIGNTVSHGYEPWEYYAGVKDLIKYVHVKDCRKNPAGGHSSAYTYPGEGDAMVREILSDLLSSGYRGVVSIEPHVASVIHLAADAPSPEARFAAYVKYGQALERLVREVVAQLPVTT